MIWQQASIYACIIVPLKTYQLYSVYFLKDYFCATSTETEGPPLSLHEMRRATILQEIPFVIPFETRTQVFSTLVVTNRSASQMRADFNEGPMINVAIRRTHLYEDAFDKLSPNNGKVFKIFFMWC